MNNFATTAIPAIGDMVNNPRLWQAYELRAAEVSSGRWVNMLVRHESAAVLAATQASLP